MSDLYYSYIQKEMEWDRISASILGPNCTLLSASPHIDNARVYRCQDRVIKLRKILGDNRLRTPLQSEYDVLCFLENKSNNLGFEPKYMKTDDFELLSMNYKSGISLERYFEINSISIRRLFKVAFALLRINLKGISHRDIITSNIKIDKKDTVVILDFDQAVITSPLQAVLNDLLGIPLAIPKAVFPFRKLIQRLLISKIPLLGKFAKLLKGSRPKKIQTTIVLQFSRAKQMTPSLIKLKDAWELAAKSNSSFPGLTSAYYSLCLEGYGYLGERSWESRWKPIVDIVPFQNKKVLELGCNMGLFSTFIRLRGANKCVGLDVDKGIIESARLIAEVFGVDNQYEVEDFDKEAWSTKYEGFDLVIALSVLNWLRNKEEFLRFLATHRELIFEGHETFQIEYDRLISCGFKYLQIISVSDRGRTVFYAKK